MARSPKKKQPNVEYASPETPRVAEASPRGPARRALLIAAALLFAAVVVAYSGGAWMSVLYRLIVDGVALAAWLAAAAGLGGVVLLALPVTPAREEHAPREVVDEVPGGERLLHLVTAAALGLGFLSLATLGLGLAGWLNRATAFAMLAAGIVAGVVALARTAAWRNRDHANAALTAWLAAPAGWAWLWLAVVPFFAVAVVASLLPPGVMWPGEPLGYDVVEYHLQIPREWYELGRIVPLRHNAFSYFPFNVEMHYLLAMHLHGGPWAGMYLAHFMHLATIVLTILAVYGFALPLSGTRTRAIVTTVALATVPWLWQLGSIGYNEGGLLLFGTLSMGWAFRAAITPARRPGRFPVAGLLAGFACGSKLTGVPEVLVAVGGLAFLAILIDHGRRRRRQGDKATRGQGDRETAEQGGDASPVPAPPLPLIPLPPLPRPVPLTLRLLGVASFFLAGVLAFAPWLVRNEVWAGNPVFPEAAGVLGQGHFSDAQVDRWKQAHAPRPDQRGLAARLKAWAGDVWLSWQYGYLLLPLGLAAGVAAACLSARPAAPGRTTPHEPPTPNSNILKNMRIGSVNPSDPGRTRNSNILKNIGIAEGGPGGSAFPGSSIGPGSSVESSGAGDLVGSTGPGGSRGPAGLVGSGGSGTPGRPVVPRNVGMFAFLTIAMFVGLSVFWLGFTHLQGRFFILGVPIAGLMLAAGMRVAGARRAGTPGVAGLVVVAAAAGFVHLHLAFWQKFADRPEWSLMVGLEDFERTFVPKAYDEAADDGDAPLVLVGDAKVFGYVMPMSRITYRTVFDVDALPGESAIEAWSAGAPAGAWRLVDPGELTRFNRTYRDIPALPPAYADRVDAFALPPGPVPSTQP